MLKRLTALLLLCALLSLTACSQPPDLPEPEAFDPGEPLTICFDLDNPLEDSRHYTYLNETSQKYSGGRLRQEAADQFLQEMKDAGGPENVQVEFIEWLGADRDGQLTHLRAELMAGKGPDLFVIGQSEFDNLFLFPEKKMADGLFLPLDGYMESARFMEPEGMVTAVFDAGICDGRRYLLPMTYHLYSAAMRTSKLELDISGDLSFDDMIESDVLSVWNTVENEPFSMMEQAMGQLADYKKESLSFTEEKLREFYAKLLEYNLKLDAGEVDRPTGLLVGDLAGLDSNINSRSWAMEPVTMVPLFSVDGTVTARVDHYAAVNANTDNPAGAFWAADFLLGRDFMQNSDLYMYMWDWCTPIYKDLMGPDTPLPYTRTKSGETELTRQISERHWGDYQGLIGLITDAEFPTQLDFELTVGYYDYYRAENDSAREKVVSEVYTTMWMMLGES